jgi:hypothetical protein
MSTLVAQTISNGTVSTSSANVIQGSAKAWVNFNGTVATPSTIRASYNVSSVTRRATGQYTVNFTNALADANFVVAGTHSDVGGDVACLFSGNAAYGGNNTSTTSTVNTTQFGTLVNPTVVFVAFFR